MTTPINLKVAELVAEAFRNASENGFSFEGASADEIAEDMMQCDAEIAELDEEEVVRAVEMRLAAWAAERE